MSRTIESKRLEAKALFFRRLSSPPKRLGLRRVSPEEQFLVFLSMDVFGLLQEKVAVVTAVVEAVAAKSNSPAPTSARIHSLLYRKQKKP
jgi:hypothetical protein